MALEACRGNLERLRTSLDLYSARNGRPPSALEVLIPRDLTAVPTCPAAATDTYSAGYSAQGTTVILSCHGEAHRGATGQPDTPRLEFTAETR